jgi:CrcB protein
MPAMRQRAEGRALREVTEEPAAPADAAPAGGSIGAALGGPQALRAAVFAGGTIGAVARLGLGRAIPVTPGSWPWPTFVANVLGTLLLGYLTTRLLERLPPSTHLRPLLGTGFCGAFTTFSTFQVEAIQLGRDGHAALAAAYVAASIAAGMLAVAASTALVRRARVRHR